MAATIKDIAKRTGLGLATISKYLNGGNVRDKNRVVIEAAIREMDFTVNEFARGLKTRRSRTVGVVIPELSNGFITTIISAMEDVLRRESYGVLVCDCRSDPELETQAISFLQGKQVDALALMSVGGDASHLLPHLNEALPLVLIDRDVPGLEARADAVLVNNFSAAKQCTELLLKAGHEKIGIVLGPKRIHTSKQRRNGYRMALSGAGMLPDSALICHTDYSIRGGLEATKELLAGNPGITALFVTNYETTVGAMLALGELGIRVPEQLSLIGFDNLELAQIFHPPLTVVEQPMEQIGREAAALLLARLRGDNEAARRVLLDTALRQGESVKRLIP
ncbi:MAG: LacI family DNA-binding transcriptional regulator [Oscillospiraceae bacterium]